MINSPKTKKILIISLDAFRYDYLASAVFLKELAAKNSSGKLKTIFGYTGIGAAINTGKYPKDSGIWLEFLYSPKDSPFKILKFISFLDRPPFSKLIRLLVNVIFVFGRYLRGGSYLASIKNIPFSQIQNFNTSLYVDWAGRNPLKNKGVKSLFDHLRENNINFLYYDWPIRATNKKVFLDLLTKNKDEDKVNKLIQNRAKADLFWLRIWEMDSISHCFGPQSNEAKQAIKTVDSLCKKIYAEFSKFYEVEFLFWSDHGMVEVKEKIDLRPIVKNINYPYFLDSTLARFWPKSEPDRDDLIKNLNQISGGRVLLKDDFDKYQLDFNDKRYGEVVFAADPGNIIFPNFYNATPPKGMHGYDPDLAEQQALYISSLGQGVSDKKMTEMYDEILNLIKK